MAALSSSSTSDSPRHRRKIRRCTVSPTVTPVPSASPTPSSASSGGSVADSMRSPIPGRHRVSCSTMERLWR